MQINAYLQFAGNCEDALTFYKTQLGAEITFMMRHKDAPAEAPPGWDDKIMHASLQIGESTLMASDAPPGLYHIPAGFRVSLSLNDPEQAESIFAALAKGGSIAMPIQKTFWATRFGMVTDRFGTPWMINCM